MLKSKHAKIVYTTIILFIFIIKTYAQVQFESTAQILTDTPANDIASEDFDGDGIEDILVTVQSSNSLKLFRGNPGGAFSQPTDVLAGGESDEIAIADFNNDGALDIAVNLTFKGRVSIMLNNGSGSFSNSSFLVDEQPYDIISFDANGDEFPDLAVGHNSGKNVKVYTGNGDGTFENSYNSNHNELVRAIISGDVNGDGHVDLISSAYNKRFMSLFLGNGDGTFTQSSNINHNLNQGIISDMELIDINDDNHLDLIAIGLRLTVHLGDGAGNFTENQHININRHDDIGGVEITDFNGDNHLDLVYGKDERLGLLEGNGMGKFENEVVLFAPGTKEFTLIDFNSDGIEDIATTGVILFEGTATNGFQGPRFFDVRSGGGFITTADFNNDGYIDVITSNGFNAELLVGQEAGFFSQQLSLSLQSFNTLITGDANDDGFEDILLSDNENSVTVLINDQTAVPGFSTSQSYLVGDTPAMLFLAEINDDGLTDLVTYNENNTVSILLGNDNGMFDERLDLDLSSFTGSKGIFLSDFDQNGQIDILVDGTFSIVPGTSSGTFDLGQSIPIGIDQPSGEFTTYVEDITGEGDLDVVISAGNDLIIYKGNEGLDFDDGIIAHSFGSSTPRDIAFGDIDNDELTDLVTLGNGTLSVFLSRPNATLETPFQFISPPGGNSIVLADVTNDGLNDIIQSKMVIHENFYLETAEIEISINGENLIFGSSIDFGRVNIDDANPGITISIANTGVEQLAISGFDLDNDDFIIQGLEQATVAPGNSLEFTIAFQPTLKQNYNSTLEILSNDPNESAYEIALIGSGLGIPAITISLSAPGNNITEGLEVNFTSELTHGGENPSVFWFVNDSFQSNSLEFLTTSLVDGDIVKATLKSDDPLVSIDSVESNELTVSVQVVLSTDETLDSQDVKVYPNPVSTTLIIQEKGSREIKSVEIINASGQSIKYREHTNELMEIDVSDLGQGLYTIVIRSSKEIVTRKIIVR